MTNLTEAELHDFLEALSRRQGGGNQGEMAQAVRFLESQGWQFKAPQSSATE
jgi:Mn-containing catalase